MTYVHCPECGYQNVEAAQYCAKCGAFLVSTDPAETTMTFSPGGDEQGTVAIGRAPTVAGRTLVVHHAGREAETVSLDAERMTIGRSPDCDVFLDDVTVSRVHAVLVREGRSVMLEDQSSLNGTFVNRRRVERAKLADADEIQIGKYRLTFLDR